jgi:septum formation protein
MLKTLSGATHHVSTGVCLISGAAESTFVETTDVRFRKLTESEIEAYVECGEPADKAGAYAIQGGAHGFVDALDGDYDNVVGLPVRRLLEELSKLTPNSDQLNL